MPFSRATDPFTPKTLPEAMNLVKVRRQQRRAKEAIAALAKAKEQVAARPTEPPPMPPVPPIVLRDPDAPAPRPKGWKR